MVNNAKKYRAKFHKKKYNCDSFRELKHLYKWKQISQIRKDMRRNPEKYDSIHLKAELRRLDGEYKNFCDDPMTVAYGVAGEFRGDYMGRGQKVFLELCNRGEEEFDGDCATYSRWSHHEELEIRR